MARAATTRLEPGQHSIDRAQPFPHGDGWALRWRLRLPSGRLLDKTSKAPTKALLRARARQTAQELLTAPGTRSWTQRTPVLEYMEAVTLPALRVSRLSDETTRRYELSYRLLRGECGKEKCKHEHSLAGLTIHDAMRPRALTRCLEEIGELHGEKNVKHARIVLKKYLAAPLRVDELIEANPVSDLELDLSEAKQPEQRRGGKALSLDEYRAVIDYLLRADPNDLPPRRQGRWSREVVVTQRAQAIDLILAQAATGLRTSEVAKRPLADCTIDQDGTFIFWLPDAAVKTRKGRPVPVLDPRVSERLKARMDAAAGTDLFPSPADASKAWDPRNRDRKIAEMYLQMAADLEIGLFKFERGHLWRATLNTLLYDELPEATRVRLLGHSAAVNRSHYTAVTSTKAVVEAARMLREDEVESPQEAKKSPQKSP